MLINAKRSDGGAVGDILRVEDSDVPKFRIVDDGDVLISGNVGLATSSPQVRLHLENSDGTDEFLRFSDSAAGSVAAVRAYQQYYMGNNTTRVGYFGFTTDETFDMATTSSNGALRFIAGNNAVAMKIKSDGKVGIGTEIPTAKLEVIGDISGYTGLFSQKVGIGTHSPTDILTINQTADSNGIRINGYDDHSSSFVKLFVDSNGHAELSQSTTGGDGYLELKAENYVQLSAGSFVFTDDEFRIFDDGQLSLGKGADYKIKYDKKK